ncbi:FecR family protein [Steroidobacter flavus]|uniref:FecR family protein n=1 Tax=Steroidobacter flavus TaxID=1842136 RepID=A0ABV8T2Q4_9GAMM
MHGNTPPQILAEAERWYVRLKAADCRPEERLEFERWQAIPEHAAAFAKTEAMWQSFDSLADREDMELLTQQVFTDTAHRPPPMARRVFIAASVVAAVGGGVFLYTVERKEPTVVYATGAGERKSFDLTDGSVLSLNVATEVEIRFSDRARHVTLRRGEALFKVAHDKTRPFTVATADGQVIALGTRFQVRNDDAKITVTLLEGSVAVSRPQLQQRTVLVPGEQLHFASGETAIARRNVDTDVVSSWSTGRLRFRATPLADVLAEVNRYSNRKIRIDDASLRSTPINGAFAVGDSDSVADALVVLLHLHVSHRDDLSIVLASQ